MESAPAAAVLHAIAEQGVPIRLIAEAIAAALGLPGLSVEESDVDRCLGFLGGF